MLVPLVTLTTDFGEDSPYVAAIKGVILGIHPQVQLVDLSHQIPPQNLRHAAFFLANTIPHFPREAIHVIVVDPGVGSERALFYVNMDGHRLLVPDNGCWTPLTRGQSAPPVVRRLEEPRYWRSSVSATFHGRDILAPVAAWLSRGLNPDLLGPTVLQWATLEIADPQHQDGRWKGEIVFVDHFGNLITNIPGEAVLALAESSRRITIQGEEISGLSRTYAEAEPGTMMALLSSCGNVEIAVNQGNAAARLQAGPATPVLIGRRSSE
jgi:S-adenosylmethionine hydrolase